MTELKRCYWMIRHFIILKYNVFIDRAPCTKLHKREQKDRTKTLPEFPNHVLKDYDEYKLCMLFNFIHARYISLYYCYAQDFHNFFQILQVIVILTY